jgi:peptidoglycan/LPS O-acetylase OafA/YrhL
MTRERAFGVLIICMSAVVLAADVAYAATHWTGAFVESYLIALVGLAIAAALGGLVRVALPPNRGPRVRRIRNGILRLTIVTLVLVTFHSAGSQAGEFLGLAAGLALTFLLVAVMSGARSKRNARMTP